MNWARYSGSLPNKADAVMFAIIDPSTQQELNVGYYVFTSLVAALVGFVAATLVIHFYDESRPRSAQEDEVSNKRAARKVAVGTAAVFAVLWIMAKRIGGP